MLAESRKKESERRNLCLIIPTLNERENIHNLLKRMNEMTGALPFRLTVVVVDDNSSDGTAAAVKESMSANNGVRLIQRQSAEGIGSAYLDGFRYGIGVLRADFVGEMDADLQHPPEFLGRMCDKSFEGFDVVIASRYIEGGGSKGWSLSRKIVSRGANWLSKIFIRAPVSDATSGFRILSARAVSGLLEFKLSSRGYAFQVESLCVYKRLGMSFAEVPYVFGGRKVGKTKLKIGEMMLFAYIVIKVGIFGVKRRSQDSTI